MSVAKAGDFVQVFYTGSLSNGEVFDSNEGGRPLEFQLGRGQVIEGFDAAVTGMGVGQEKEVSMAPEQAYGQPDPRLIMDIPLSQVPPNLQPEVGMTLELTTNNGQPLPATVTGLTDQHLTLDLNPPLAGKTLFFKIRLAGISDAPTQMGCSCGQDPNGCCGC